MKRLKALFHNERGSVLSVSLIVIAILSFSLSVVTNDTLNLAGQTTETQNNLQNTSYGKKILDIALEEMKEFILASDSSDPVNDYLVNKGPEILNNYGVSSANVTTEVDLDPETQAAIRLSLILEAGVTISRTTYYTFQTETNNDLTGSEAVAEILNDPENFDPNDPYEINFYFSLVTNGDVIMNGGYYNFPAIFASNIYMHNRAHYVWNDNLDNQNMTPTYQGSDPRYKGGNDTKIFYDQFYKYCTNDGCITPGTSTTDTIIHKDDYSDVKGSMYQPQGDIQDYKLEEFFTSFVFDDNFLDFLQNDAPNSALDRTLTMDNYETALLDPNNSQPLGESGKNPVVPNAPFVDVTNNFQFYLDNVKNKTFSIIYDARTTPLVLTEELMLSSQDLSIVILGDLIIDGAGAKNANQNEHTIIGNLIVTGNVTMQGGSNMASGDKMSLANTIITLGDVTFDFDPGYALDNTKNGSVNTGNFAGLVLLAKGNIYFYSFNEPIVAGPLYTSDDEVINLYAFIYSEESVFIDAVKSHVRFEGAIYARASENITDPSRLMPYKDDQGNQIHGIIINSFNGWLTDDNEANVNVDDIMRFHMTNLTVDKMQLAFDGLPRFEVRIRSDQYFIDDGYEVN